jgi:hypothetical protein
MSGKKTRMMNTTLHRNVAVLYISFIIVNTFNSYSTFINITTHSHTHSLILYMLCLPIKYCTCLLTTLCLRSRAHSNACLCMMLLAIAIYSWIDGIDGIMRMISSIYHLAYKYHRTIYIYTYWPSTVTYDHIGRS